MDILKRNFDVLRLKQENLSANASNVTTPGYKFQSLIQSTLDSDLAINHSVGQRRSPAQELGDFTFGNQIDEAVIHMNPGKLQLTDNSTDFAVMGNNFFTIDGPNGAMYTKNGRFTVSDTGQLITREGYPVQTTGNIVFNPMNQDLIVDQNGYINGTDAQLVLTSFGEDALTPIDNGYFTGIGGVQNDGTAVVYQGYLESSNLEMADMMVEMMQISREYEANQKVLHASNETLQKATNQVGKV